MPLETSSSGAHRTYRLSGELDLLNADQLAERLEPDSMEQGDLILDLTDLAFIDSSGIRVLLRTADRLQGRGRLVLRSPSRQVQVVLSLVGLAKDGSGIVVEGALEPEWGKPVSRTFAAERAALADVRRFVRRRAVDDSFGEWADAIVLAVSEAATNAVLHSGAGEVQVTWRPYADHAELEVSDAGVFKRAIGPAVGGGNRGFLLMMSLMDQISISCGTDTRPGTIVRMVKRRNGGKWRVRPEGSADSDRQRPIGSEQRVAL